MDGALTVADRLAEYMLVNNMSSDSELGVYLVNKGITPFPDRFKPYINYAHMGAEYREKHACPFTDRNDCCMSHHSNSARVWLSEKRSLFLWY